MCEIFELKTFKYTCIKIINIYKFKFKFMLIVLCSSSCVFFTYILYVYFYYILLIVLLYVSIIIFTKIYSPIKRYLRFDQNYRTSISSLRLG